jgi:hypothetical protein
MEVDLSPLDFYLTNLPQMNDLSRILIESVLYNKFHSSLSINTLSMKQKYILLLYVRRVVMQLYSLSEDDTKSNQIVNMLTAKTVNHTTKTLTQKDLNSVKKYVKLNNLKEYLLTDNNVTAFVESIMHTVLSSYTIVNHNDKNLLDVPLQYDANTMTLDLLDMCVRLFDYIAQPQ